MTHTVIGFFRNSTDAYHAADVLKDRGFDNDNIDVSSSFENVDNDDDKNERSGKIGNFFKSLFSDDDDNANRYSKYASKNSLVTVYADSSSEAENAAAILDDCGAIDIDETGDMDFVYSESGVTSDVDNDMTTDRDTFRDRDNVTDLDDMEAERPGMFRSETDSDMDRDRTFRVTSDRDFDNTSEASIPIIEEEVNVGKREVRKGSVRVRSRIIERPVEETLRLREERIRVERNPADREASAADLDNFHEETIEVTEFSEEPVVSKRSRVVEEVKVGKDVHEREETVRETERKTEVDIENVDEEDLEKSHTHHRRR